MSKITEMDALSLGRAIGSHEVKVSEATEEYLKSVKEQDEKYNCYVTVDEEGAMKAAAEVQARIDRGELKDSPLAGVPVAIKDNMCTAGLLTTCSSRILYNFVPT